MKISLIIKIVGTMHIVLGVAVWGMLIFKCDFRAREVSQWLWNKLPLPMASPEAPEHFSGPTSGLGIITFFIDWKSNLF